MPPKTASNLNIFYLEIHQTSGMEQQQLRITANTIYTWIQHRGANHNDYSSQGAMLYVMPAAGWQL